MSQINNIAMLLEFMRNCGIKLAIKPEGEMLNLSVV